MASILALCIFYKYLEVCFDTHHFNFTSTLQTNERQIIRVPIRRALFRPNSDHCKTSIADIPRARHANCNQIRRGDRESHSQMPELETLLFNPWMNFRSDTVQNLNAIYSSVPFQRFSFKVTVEWSVRGFVLLLSTCYKLSRFCQ